MTLRIKITYSIGSPIPKEDLLDGVHDKVITLEGD